MPHPQGMTRYHYRGLLHGSAFRCTSDPSTQVDDHSDDDPDYDPFSPASTRESLLWCRTAYTPRPFVAFCIQRSQETLRLRVPGRAR